ncbi:MAG: hypothetical protein QOF26_1653, partial [Baekduia sp.]|nr:hypothetical protein [Baekduia sp.]
MLKPLNEMPAGTIGFEAVGEVEDDDWERSVEWVRPARRGLSFLLPGQARAFPVSDLEAGKRWLAEGRS